MHLADSRTNAYLQGALPNLPLERQRALIDEYQRLNPRSEWAARERLRLDHPGGHPQGYFHWEPRSGRLVPIAQAGDITDIALRNPTSADLESIAFAGRCKWLTLSPTNIPLDPLRHLTTLEKLYLYDGPSIDCTPLATLSNLRELTLLRCTVRHLDALVTAPALTKLRLEYSNHVESERLAVRAAHPGIGISL